jgi:hypothetical protein
MSTFKRVHVLGTLVLSLVCSTHAASPLFINYGTLTNVPQVDAVVFANHGLFSVFGVLPYETQNTLFFTNRGTMTGSPGFRLETVPPFGPRRPASTFYNGVDATVTAGGFQFVGIGAAGALLAIESSQTRIWATNVVNKGHIEADSAGLVRILGQSVDLSRSSVGILPVTGGGGSLTLSNFFPDRGVTDVYWGMNNDGSSRMNSSTLVAPIPQLTNYLVRTPQHRVTNTFFGQGALLNLTNASGYVITNQVTPTNWIVDAVFVQSSNPDLLVDVRFAPSTIATNPYSTAIVEFLNPETNVLDGSEFLTQFYLIDRTASETNWVLLTNLFSGNTRMPSTFEVTRFTPFEFFVGAPGDPEASTNAAAIIYNPAYSNTFVTNIYSAYSFSVTNISSVPPQVPGVSLTNIPGRVEIAAGDLNLNRTRIRGEGSVNIIATNLTGTNMVIDVQNLSLRIGSRTGNLLVQNMVPNIVERTSGEVRCWSAVWTNATEFIEATGNQIPDPNDPTMMIDEMVTNAVEIGFHVLVVDSSAIVTRVPVLTANFEAHSTTVTIGDTLRFTETALFDTENLVVTETGNLVFGGTSPDLNADNAPRLRTFVNSGSIQSPGSVFLGTDRPQPLSAIINRGSMQAFTHRFRSDFFENSGFIEGLGGGFFSAAPGGINVQAGRADLIGGTFTSPGDVEITARDLTMEGYSIESDQSVILSISNSLSDGGQPDGNYIKSEGFHILVRPLTGDFLGTTFETVGPAFLEILHTAAGQDRGATPQGFINNAAIGHLILDGQTDTLFRFRGVGQQNALYVDFLELRGSTEIDPLSSLWVDPNLIVYFAASNVPADQLNGLFADAAAPLGRLRWVQGFMGPNSTATVPVKSSGSVLMNRSLRESMVADSDGDGIPNKNDQYPLDPDSAARIMLSNVALIKDSGTISFAWSAQPGMSYVVEFTTDLKAANWQVLKRHTNTTQTAASVVVQDQVQSGVAQRFYRIRPQ